MRISTKGHHAVMAMADLTRNGQGKPVSLTDIATRQGISVSYMEQLIARLKSHGLVKSYRGPGGGYILGGPSYSITVAQVIDAVDDPLPHYVISDPMTASERQMTDLLWQSVGEQISAYLATVTLADVCNCTLCVSSDASHWNDGADKAA